MFVINIIYLLMKIGYLNYCSVHLSQIITGFKKEKSDSSLFKGFLMEKLD